jgi:hypothetical protein
MADRFRITPTFAALAISFGRPAQGRLSSITTVLHFLSEEC